MSSGPEYYAPLLGNESAPGMQPSTLQQQQQQIHHPDLMAEEQTPNNPGMGDDDDEREGDDDDDGGDEGLGEGEEGDISMTEGAFSETPQYHQMFPPPANKYISKKNRKKKRINGVYEIQTHTSKENRLTHAQSGWNSII